MQFNWNADTIRWYIDADYYSGFYKRITDTIAPAVGGYQSLCDLGCGLGLFDFEAATLFESIECVDINETALAYINKRTAELGIRHIVTHLEDSNRLRGQWDVIFMSFFGSRDLVRFLPHCKKLFAVVPVAPEPEIFPIKEKITKNMAADVIKTLMSEEIDYKLIYRQLEFGQPFVSLDDARRCMKSYAPGISDDEADAFLNSRMQETRGEVYPYYIPRMKSVGIFELDGALQ